MASRVLVTGGEGMIGQALRNVTKFDSWDLRSDLDVMDLSDCGEAYEGIIHLAARSRVVDGFHQPLETWTVNTIGTLAVLEKARKDGSWVIYGSSLTAGRSMNVYSFSKEAGEKLCTIYAKNYRVRTISVQFSTVYGSNLDLNDRFIPYMAAKLKSDSQELYLEDRDAWLSPTHIDDVADTILDFVNSEKQSWSGGVFPIISEEGFMRTEDLARTMCAVAGLTPKLHWGKKREWDTRLRIDISNGIRVPIPFEDGFRRYYRSLQKL